MRTILILLALSVRAICFGQTNYKVVSIDSTDTYYTVKVQKLNKKVSTTIYTPKNQAGTGQKIAVGKLYAFHFAERYKIGSPELRYDENGNEKFIFKNAKFKKNNSDTTYTALELAGLRYSPLQLDGKAHH